MRKISLLWVKHRQNRKHLPYRKAPILGNALAVLRQRASSAPNAAQRSPRPRLWANGPVLAAQKIRENSAWNVARKSPRTVGSAPAVQKTRVSSAPNAARESPQAFRSTVATNAVGNPKRAQSHRNSVQNAATPLTTEISNNRSEVHHGKRIGI